MSAVFTIGNLWARLGEIRDCAFDAVSLTAAGPPQRSCVVPGEVVWDECQCGMLAVNWRVVSRSNTFPASASETSQTSCATPYTTVQVGVTMLRCTAGMDENGEAPTCAALEDDAFVMTADMVAIRGALGCCLQSMYRDGNLADWAMGQTISIGPQGGCDGSFTDLILGFSGGGCCA